LGREREGVVWLVKEKRKTRFLLVALFANEVIIQLEKHVSPQHQKKM